MSRYPKLDCELNLKTISIIGSGWLAQPLALFLINLGHKVTLTSTRDSKVLQLKSRGSQALNYQLGQQKNKVEQLFGSDIIIVAITSKDTLAYQKFISQISNNSDQHVLYISSTSVYQNNGQRHDENSQHVNQQNPNWQIEQLIQSLPSASIIRFAGLTGPDRHPGRFFNSGRSIKNPDAPVNLVHLDDCIGLVNSVISRNKWHEVFNGCADTHPSKLTYYTHMAALLGLDAPKFENNCSGSDKIIDNQKSKSVLGYSYQFPDVMAFSFRHKNAH